MQFNGCFYPKCLKVPRVWTVHIRVQAAPRGNQPFNQESEHKNALLVQNVEGPEQKTETSVTVIKRKKNQKS